MLNKGTQTFLAELFRIGAIKVDTKTGFELAIHDIDPHAPLSPIYVSLRTKRNPKPGPLGTEHIRTIAIEINAALRKTRWEFDYIAGIPRAGSPIADALARLRKRLGMPVHRISLRKGVKKTRSFWVDTKYSVKANGGPRPRLVLVDDLVTSATVKMKAVEAARKAGYDVVGIVVYLDREQGGLSQLNINGVPTIAAITFSEMLKHYEESGDIARDDMKIIRKYLHKAGKT